MSLFKVNISQVTGRGAHLFSDETSVLINGSGVRALEVDNPTSSRFQYMLNLKNDQAGDVRIEVSQSITNIRNAVNRDYVDRYVNLTVYEGPNINSRTHVYTFNAEHISVAYNFSGGSIVYLRQGVILERMTVVETIEEIINDTLNTTTTTTFPAGIEIVSARIPALYPTLLRVTFTAHIDDATITGANSIEDTFSIRVNDAYYLDLTGAFYWTAGLGFSIYLGDPAYSVSPTDVLTITYKHDGGGGMGWNNGSGDYLDDFQDFPVTNNVTTTTTSTSTTSTTSTSSTSSTSSSSTSSTSTSSTSSTSTSSTSSSSTSSTSSSSTSTTSTSSTSTSSTSSTSTSSTSTSSTSTSSTSTTSTSSTTTGTTSTSTTSTSSTSTSSTSTSSTSSTSTTTTYETFEFIRLYVNPSTTIIMTFPIDTLDNPSVEDCNNHFTFEINGVPVTITGVNDGFDSSIRFYIDTAVEIGDVLTMTYTWLGSPLITEFGGPAVLREYTDEPAENDVTTTSTSTSTSTSSTSTSSTSSTTTGEYDAEYYWDDGADYFRLQVRSASLNLDQTITPTGFAGIEDTDWGNINSWHL